MREDRVLLEHILLAIARIEAYSADGEEAFFTDTRTQDAIIRNLEIIGEATKGLSPDLRGRHEQIPWKQVAGMRDFLIHVYFGVNLERVWQTVQTDIRPLRDAVESELTGSDE
ncbi:MAG: DUF86 domain-containing protein [Fimbriimonadaceae bacterium]|nr:DUF86 domain-containing protein [Fimbriimonadaceae bacterium]